MVLRELTGLDSRGPASEHGVLRGVRGRAGQDRGKEKREGERMENVRGEGKERIEWEWSIGVAAQ